MKFSVNSCNSVGSGMRIFLIVGHWPKILLQNSTGAS
jgi:hypothetical protein